MDTNLLVLNLGNSRLAVGVFLAGKLQGVTRIPHAQRADWEKAIDDAWTLIFDKASPAIAGAGVNPPMQEVLNQLVLDATGQAIQWVGTDLDLPVAVKTDSPQQTGVDRVLNVAAAYEQMGAACVVVDAGTAVTVDCCGDAGEFLGGAIAPGLGMMLDVLHEKTAKLPRAAFAPPVGAIGRSTEAAICQGVYYAIRGLVREVAENYATEIGRWPEIIATGGDAAQLFADWEVIHAISPDLTLYGIALAYVNHHLKHEA